MAFPLEGLYHVAMTRKGFLLVGDFTYIQDALFFFAETDSSLLKDKRLDGQQGRKMGERNLVHYAYIPLIPLIFHHKTEYTVLCLTIATLLNFLKNLHGFIL